MNNGLGLNSLLLYYATQNEILKERPNIESEIGAHTQKKVCEAATASTKRMNRQSYCHELNAKQYGEW